MKAVTSTPSSSLYEDALDLAAGMIYDAWRIGYVDDVTIASLAEEITDGRVLHLRGSNSAGTEFLFEWDFHADDVPALIARATEIDTETEARKES